MKIITVSGIDGSGKTSAARHIQKTLTQKNKRVKMVHLAWELPGTSNSDLSEGKKGPHPLLVKLKDTMTIYAFLLRYLFYDAIIFDRYSHDTAVKLAYRKTPLRTRLPVPKPHLTFYLASDPKQTFKRDNDHSELFHIEKTALYEQYFAKHAEASIIRVETTKPLKAVHAAITDALRGAIY